MNRLIALCLMTITMATACMPPISPNGTKPGLQNTVPRTPMFVQLAANPVQVTIVKNDCTTAVTDSNQLNVLVHVVNTLPSHANPEHVHCMVITPDHYTLTFHYKNGSVRSFHNDGGACQPLVDDQSDIRLLGSGPY